MYFIKINITKHELQSEIENRKANVMLLFYMDSIYWTYCISANKENLGWLICG